MKNIEKQQKHIVETIKKEISKNKIDDADRPSSYLHSVWFVPSKGKFLWYDTFIHYDVIYPLIEDYTLIFKAFESHQGEIMVRYILSLYDRYED